MVSKVELPIALKISSGLAKPNRFRLNRIDAFDARHGYRRCMIPGLRICILGSPSAIADFWKDRTGQLVVRLSSQGYGHHFSALLVSGTQVCDRDLPEFESFFAKVMVQWITDGVDDDPSLPD